MTHGFALLKLPHLICLVNLEFHFKTFLSPNGKKGQKCSHVFVLFFSVKMQGSPPHVTMKNRGHIFRCSLRHQNVSEERLILL